MVHAVLLALTLTSPPEVRLTPLFVVARSTNANVVEYVARIDHHGLLEEPQPFEAHWVLKAEDGRHEPLSYFEQLMAYGFSWKPRRPGREYALIMNAFPSRTLVVVPRDADYQVITAIGGTPSRLTRLFVTAEGGAAVPQVKSVELFGQSLVDGTPTHEWLVPPTKGSRPQARRDDPF